RQRPRGDPRRSPAPGAGRPHPRPVGRLRPRRRAALAGLPARRPPRAPPGRRRNGHRDRRRLPRRPLLAALTRVSAMRADPATPRPGVGAGSGPRRAGWSGVLLLALAVLAGATLRTLFSPLQEAAKLELGLSDLQISLVQGMAFAVPIAIFAIPLGWLADRS